MGAVAERPVFGMFASAPGDHFRFGDFYFPGLKSCSLMGAVTEGLAFRSTTSAPPISAGLDFLNDGSSLEDNGFRHIESLQIPEEKTILFQAFRLYFSL